MKNDAQGRKEDPCTSVHPYLYDDLCLYASLFEEGPLGKSPDEKKNKVFPQHDTMKTTEVKGDTITTLEVVGKKHIYESDILFYVFICSLTLYV